MKSGPKGILLAGLCVAILMVVSCTQCLVCETVGNRCYECASSTGFEAIYCEVDSNQLADLQISCNTLLVQLTDTQSFEQCSDSKAQLDLLEANYESYKLDCRRQ